MSTASDRVVVVGQITGVHGVKGWVKVHSFTEPRTNLLDYRHWLLDRHGERQSVEIEATGVSGKKLLAKLVGVDDRDQAAELAGVPIGVYRSAMPALESGEYYWADLEGLVVRNLDGERLGSVKRVIATGANDVLLLDGRGERMIPFAIGDTVRQVDLAKREIVVDWDRSYWE